MINAAVSEERAKHAHVDYFWNVYEVVGEYGDGYVKLKITFQPQRTYINVICGFDA